MIVTSETIFSTIVDATLEEIKSVERILVCEDGSTLLKNDRFYTGLINYLRSNGIHVTTDYGVEIRNEVDFSLLTLRDYQLTIVRKALLHNRGIVQSVTASGKTRCVVALSMCFNGKITIIVPTGYLMQQTVSVFKEFGIHTNGVGYGSKFDDSRIQIFVDKSAVNALNKCTEAGEHIRDSELLIIDEGHHVPANTYITICEQCKAEFRYVFTATAFDDPTIEDRTKRDLTLMGLIGPIIVNIRGKELRSKGYIANSVVTILPIHSGNVFGIWNPRAVYKIGIVNNKVRNSKIAHLAVSLKSGAYRTMIFVMHKKQGFSICSQIAKELGSEVLFVMGGETTVLYQASGTVKTLSWSMDKIAEYINRDNGCIVVATRVLDEGIDIPSLNCVIMAAALKKYRRYVQRIGRGMRPKSGDNTCYIFDFYDTNHKMLEAHSKERMNTYVEEEFTFSESVEQTERLLGIKLNLGEC
jgi:superfamily II DNA or RNA helicase